MASSSNLSGLGTRRRPRRLPFIPVFSWLFILLSAGLFGLELIRFSQQLDTLNTDVTVAGVNVGGLSASEAVSRWEQAYGQPITLWYDQSPILLDPGAVGFHTNQEAMLASARAASEAEASFWSRFFNYLLGRDTQRVVNVNLSADYQESMLEQFLTDVAARYDRAPGEASYDVQTLTMRTGGQGFVLDIDQAMEMVDAALRNPNQRQVTLPISDTNASLPSIDALRDMIIAYLDSQGFIYDGQSTVGSIFIMDLESGAEVNILGDVAMSAASTMKVPILTNYFRTLSFAPNEDIAYIMAQSLLCSNNSSSNYLIELSANNDLFAGLGNINNMLQYLGIRNTYISAAFDLGDGQVLGSIPAPTTAPNPDFNTGADTFNQTTAEDLGTLFSMIYDCAYFGSGLIAAYPDGEFTAQECRQVLNLMSANDLERLLQGGIPPDAILSHKNGWLDNVHGDAGIVFPPNGRNYVIAVFLWQDGDFFTFERAWPLIEGISRAAWNYFVPDQPLIAARTDLPEQAQACDVFAPEYGEVNLDNINGWRGGSAGIP
jgi:beta-lactamase class A